MWKHNAHNIILVPNVNRSITVVDTFALSTETIADFSVTSIHEDPQADWINMTTLPMIRRRFKGSVSNMTVR